VHSREDWEVCSRDPPKDRLNAYYSLHSGKSSLVLTLLRLLDLSSGSIEIDGVDISSLARDRVRARIIAVAEESFFFPGTIRQNADPYSEFDDGAIEEAMSDVALWDVIVEKGGLDQTLKKEEMLSQGQRQLFQFGRAILRRHVGKILVVDEITSRYVHAAKLACRAFYTNTLSTALTEIQKPLSNEQWRRDLGITQLSLSHTS
jgi:ABC-type protease/lipase transport system fused ATPase/permease subunit